MGKTSRKKQRSLKKHGAVKGPGVVGFESDLSGGYAKTAAFFLIAVTVFLIYSNTFSSPFHFDDIHNIVKNYKLGDPSNFWPPSGMRYAGFLSFALNHHYGGLDVFGYHLVNVMIHIINGLLVWALIILTFKTPVMERAGINNQLKYFIALTASLIFVTHPVQTQAVTYIVQRFASLATLFYLLSLVLFVKWRISQGTLNPGLRTVVYIVSVLSAVLAMKTKEISFTLPFVILLYEFMFFRGKILNWKSLLYLAPIVLTVLIIPLSIIGTDKPVGDIIGEMREVTLETEAIPRGVYLLTQFMVIVTYIRLLFLPINQNLDYDYPLYDSLFEPGVFLSFLFLLSIFGIAIHLFIRSRGTGNAYGLLASFGIFWFFITLSVESSIIPIKDVINEHRLYLPSVGAVIAFSAGMFYLFEYKKMENFLVAVCILLVFTAIPLSVATYKRNFVWKDDVTLWEDVVSKSPKKARGHSALGLAYKRVGILNKALQEYKLSLRLEPGFIKAHNNLGDLYYDQGRTEEAIEEYKVALRLRDSYPMAHYNLGVAYYTQGRIDEAIEEYRETLNLSPNYLEAHLNLGFIYVTQGRIDEAIKQYKEALNLKHDELEAHLNLGFIYKSQGDINKAIEQYKLAIRYNPDSAKARNDLGAAYFNQGRTDEAIEEYREALRLVPGYADARFNLGLAYKQKGLKNEAIREFEEALKIKPDHEGARKMLESIKGS